MNKQINMPDFKLYGKLLDCFLVFLYDMFRFILVSMDNFKSADTEINECM